MLKKAFKSILFALWAPVMAAAQTPVGLYEGLLGNSGVALQDSSAASYYNPSLLILKKENSYSISGNTFSNFYSRSSGEENSSLSTYPSYISSVFMSESLAHELFVMNLSPSHIQKVMTNNTATANSSFESSLDITNLVGGYSMAFKSFPIALSYFAQFTQIQEFGFNQLTSLAGDLRTSSVSRGKINRLTAGISVSGHTDFDSYTLGYNLKVRPLTLLNKNSTNVTSYIRGENAPTDYRVEESKSEINFTDTQQNAMSIGHAFRTGIHEFLTDSQFVEKLAQSNSYQFSQSFGYRMSTKSGHQFLCGLNHGFGGDVTYFGQNIYTSVGYSWNNRANRSTFGLFYHRSNFDQEITSAGLSFGSEFTY